MAATAAPLPSPLAPPPPPAPTPLPLPEQEQQQQQQQQQQQLLPQQSLQPPQPQPQPQPQTATDKKLQDAFRAALVGNSEWVNSQTSSNPTYFKELAKGQAPKILWIGCSDSRIPAEQILNLRPGDLFVHRNIANVVAPGDLSSLSVIEYAVRHLKVEHAVVCGHTGCGGVAAALGNKSLGVLDFWLHPIKQLRLAHKEELEASSDRPKALAELNVLKSLKTLRENPTVLEAISERGLELHGVIYDLEEGKLTEVDAGDEEVEAEKHRHVFSFE